MKQEVYFGLGSATHLEAVLRRYGVSNLFLVTGSGSFCLSGASDAIAQALSRVNVVHFARVLRIPTTEDVEKGLSLFQQGRFDAILAVGGGSVIDVAKLVNAYSSRTRKSARPAFPARGRLKATVPLIAMPTTAGSGSETTHFAVLYRNGKKYSVEDRSLLPAVAVIDPQFTFSLPPYATATSGMDALSQAIESYWSVNSTEESKRYARESIQLVLGNLRSAVEKPSPENRLNMSRAAYLAGKAINITRTTGPHAVSYPLTAFFGVAHGHAVSLTLPHFVVYNAAVTEQDVADPRGVRYVRKITQEISSLLGAANAQDASLKIKSLMGEIELATSLRGVGIEREKDILKLVRNANLQRMRNNPRRVTSSSLFELLRAA